MMLLGILILFVILYLARWRAARIYNKRDASRDYRTSMQRSAKW